MLSNNIFSFNSFIEWLRLQPQRKRYDYNNTGGKCLIDQYLIAKRIDINSENYILISEIEINPGTTIGMEASAYPRTMGAALERMTKE